MGNYITFQMFENQRTGRQARYFTKNVPKILDLKSSSEQIFWVPLVNRELKQRQRRRQRERHKFAYLVAKNNSFARPARVFFTFVHFIAVVSKITTGSLRPVQTVMIVDDS